MLAGGGGKRVGTGAIAAERQLQLKDLAGGAQGSQPTLLQGGFKCTKLHPPELEDAARGGHGEPNCPSTAWGEAVRGSLAPVPSPSSSQACAWGEGGSRTGGGWKCKARHAQRNGSTA